MRFSKHETPFFSNLLNREIGIERMVPLERICNKRRSRIEDRRSPSSILYLQSSMIILATAFFNGPFKEVIWLS